MDIREKIKVRLRIIESTILKQIARILMFLEVMLLEEFLELHQFSALINVMVRSRGSGVPST